MTDGDTEGRPSPVASNIDYWRERVAVMGKRAVLDSRHPEESLAAVTELQKRVLYPVLESLLAPPHELLVDFGCGCGRFSGGLAELIEGRVLAVDPVAELLRLAPTHPRVEYRLLDESGRVPVADAAVDVVWCCLVLGTIHEDGALRRTTDELSRILRPGGLCLVVENISVKPGATGPYKKRSIADVTAAFPAVALQPLLHYIDIDEIICVFGGSKREADGDGRYPNGCGLPDGCGGTCLCGPCGDQNNDCFDDCTGDQICSPPV